MRFMGPVLLVVGVLAALTGLVWMGQGTGYFPHPAASTMIGEPRWAYRGAGMVAVGLAAIFFSRRL